MVAFLPKFGMLIHLSIEIIINEVSVKEKFAYKIPASISSEEAGPLLCAGATVYQPLKKYVTHPGMRVGIWGLGGLGYRYNLIHVVVHLLIV